MSEAEKKKLKDLFFKFLDEHDWSLSERLSATYSFYHTLNIIDKDKVKQESNSE